MSNVMKNLRDAMRRRGNEIIDEVGDEDCCPYFVMRSKDDTLVFAKVEVSMPTEDNKFPESKIRRSKIEGVMLKWLSENPDYPQTVIRFDLIQAVVMSHLDYAIVRYLINVQEMPE